MDEDEERGWVYSPGEQILWFDTEDQKMPLYDVVITVGHSFKEKWEEAVKKGAPPISAKTQKNLDVRLAELAQEYKDFWEEEV